jgi:thiol-disulfide isomerase/thioredoxin
MWLAGVAGIVAAGQGVALQGRVGIAPPTNQTQPTLSDDPVELALRPGRPTVIQFGAHVCAACREMKPMLMALRQAHGARFTVMNVDLIAQKHRGQLQRLRIQLMPTQVFIDTAGRKTHPNVGKMMATATRARLEGRA